MLPSGKIDSCHIYDQDKNVTSCTAWTYDRDDSNATLVSEFDLVCDRRWLLVLSKSIYFLGLMIGVFVAGWAADFFGRKPILQVLFLGMGVFGIAAAYMGSAEWFIIMRFFQGMFTIGVSVVVFCWVLEVVQGRWQVTQINL